MEIKDKAKKIVFFRTHIVERFVISEFLKIKASLEEGDECILLIDNSSNFLNINSDSPVVDINFYGYIVKCFLCNTTIYEKFNLPTYSDNLENYDWARISWYNGEYPFYYIRKYFPKFEYYWCIEYDVWCNGKSYYPFFNLYKDDNSDLLIDKLRLISDYEEWCWETGSDWLYSGCQKYAGFLPVIRLSAGAVDFLYKRRIEIGKIFEQWKKNIENRWIFCELYVPTELVKGGFKCSSIYNQFLQYQPNFNLNRERFFEHPNFKLYHPVR